MHRTPKRARSLLAYVEVKDRGVQSDPYVEEEWIEPTLRDEEQRNRFLNRPRNRGVEWLDEFRDTPQRLYLGARVGPPLLPTDRLSPDVRAHIASFTTRPSLDAGLLPEGRNARFRDLGEPRFPNYDRGGVPCPVCNRFKPVSDLPNWYGDPAAMEVHRGWMLPPNLLLWSGDHVQRYPRFKYACSERCWNELKNVHRAKEKQQSMREGSYATFYDTDWDDLAFDDYFAHQRLGEEDEEDVPTRSYRKRKAMDTVDIGV